MSDEIEVIIAALQDIYVNSPAHAQLAMEAAVAAGATLFIAKDSTQPAAAVNDQDLVTVNAAITGSLRMFNNTGMLFTPSLGVVLAHELSHLGGAHDPDAGSDSTLNGANYDQAGGAVAFENLVAADLGIADFRTSYGAALLTTGARYAYLKENFSYTEGNQVDVVRLADIDGVNNNIDHTQTTQANLLRDLIFGFTGIDTIKTGLGNDYAYGGTGDDTIEGGDGNDVLHGEVDNDVLSGGDGQDRLYGGIGDDRLNTGRGIGDIAYGGAGSDVLIASGQFNHLYGDDGAVVGGSLATDGDSDLFVVGGSLSFIMVLAK
ncbi:MAG: hypothetical protein K2P58_07170 [Hyphomonadaceae bacterium]|nr:hypothetical protein [Hyphomonadaceae bacterium]